MNNTATIESAREKYRPDKVKLLFIAEAPPSALDRFFYYENVTKGDSLFLHIVRELFPKLRDIEAKVLRNNKELILQEFKENGYYLEDGCQFPIKQGTRTSKKIEILRNNQSNLIRKIEKFRNTSKVILISSSVYVAHNDYLNSQGFDVLNTVAIPFPASGQQKKFITAIRNLGQL